MRHSALIAVLGLVAAASAARAQINIRPNQPPYVGAGVGYGYPFGYFGYYPGAYSSSWSNGFSLYGPPVPTYGTVPGAFGGADQRLSNFNNIHIYNGAGIGLGASGAGGAGPRRRHYMGGGDGLGLGMPAQPAQTTGQAIIEVKVPAVTAEVYFEGINTQQQGLMRKFLSPALQPGTTYYYKVTAKWRDGEKVVEREKSVGVRAGETTVVDFAADEAGSSAPLVGTGE